MASKSQRPVRPDRAADAIIQVLEPLAHRRSNSQVFEDFLSITEASLIMLPHYAHSLAMGQGMVKDPEHVQALWARLNQDYSQKEWLQLQEAFGILLNSSHDGHSLNFHDVIGEVFMNFGVPSKWSGQHFTPNAIARMMAQMTLDGLAVEREVHQRLRRAISATPVGEALLVAWVLSQSHNDDEGVAAFSFFAERLLPLIQETYTPYTIADPCSGSGVMLVAAMSVLPAWLLNFGLVEFHATDNDARCCRMAHVNLMLHGAASYVVRHQNSMSLEPDFSPPRYGRVRWLTPPEVVPPRTMPQGDRFPLPTTAPPVPLADLDLSTLTQLTLNL